VSAATLGARLAFAFRLLLLLCIARIVAGLVAIVLLDRDAFAWGVEVTAITLVAFAACIVAALALRRYGPGRSRVS
jgi:hypothetical protein